MEKCLPKMAIRGIIVDDAMIRGWCETVTRSVRKGERHETGVHFSFKQLNAHWTVGHSFHESEGGTWTQKADMPTGRKSPGSAVIDGKIYTIGGGGPPIVSTVYEYDPDLP